MSDCFIPLLITATERAELLRELAQAGIVLPGLTPATTVPPTRPPSPAVPAKGAFTLKILPRDTHD